MKKYISIIVLLSLFVIGCSEQASINSPANNAKTTEPNWIVLPKTEGMEINQIFSTSKLIDGKAGGSMLLNYSYNGGLFGKVTCSSSLQFPKGSFYEKITFTMTHDDGLCVSSFMPGYQFNKVLTFNVRYTGIDLTGIDLANIGFAYIAADGSIEYAVNNGINIDHRIGKIEVKDAKIPHFSRYGFVNKMN
jgi:hypothetical protein